MTKNPEKSPSSWTYEEALQNFDQFCDYFDHAASARYQSTQNEGGDSPTNNTRLTTPSDFTGEPHIDVQAT